jgi:mannose-6-phosphate isomerase-like protein (cupin superfamily)
LAEISQIAPTRDRKPSFQLRRTIFYTMIFVQWQELRSGHNSSHVERRAEKMNLRNLDNREVKETRYRAHGGGVAHMILDRRHLQTLMFLAHASVQPGEKLAGHVDPMEEIYVIQNGHGLMQVEEDTAEVNPGDAIHIPLGSFHELTNTGDEELTILVVAGLVPGE